MNSKSLPSVYAICCTSRTGSSWLCDLLTSTGCLGCPQEYLNPPRFHRLQLPEDTPLTEYLDELRQRRGHSHLGIKGALDRIKPALDHFQPVACIYLQRRAKLRQAISYYRAEQTKEWSRLSGQPEIAAPEYNPRAILKAVRTFRKRHVEWVAYFEQHGIIPLEVWYEDLLDDPQHEVQRVATFLKVELPAELELSTSHVIQRDETTEQWHEQLEGISKLPSA